VIPKRVEIVTGAETTEVDVQASVLARDDALVDMARKQAGVSPADFRRGRVIDA
jgi:hypothetical protein